VKQAFSLPSTSPRNDSRKRLSHLLVVPRPIFRRRWSGYCSSSSTEQASERGVNSSVLHASVTRRSGWPLNPVHKD